MVTAHSFTNNLQCVVVCFKNMLHSERRKGFSSLLPAVLDSEYFSPILVIPVEIGLGRKFKTLLPLKRR